MRVAIVGSGFAGSILARVLRREGHEPVLVERAAHPRFTIGESSTPLAALALERLAARYDLPDLLDLAAWGRMADRSDLGCGRKRGFTFYRHEPGRAFRSDAASRRRLLVAASPNDRIADVHWRRADVDAALVERAVAEGVEYHDRTRVTEVISRSPGVVLRVVGPTGRAGELSADLAVDATGPGGLLAERAGLHSGPSSLRTGLVFAHLEGTGTLAAAAVSAGAPFEPGPYPDEWSAVHHLLDEGWIYELRFDDGVVSAGLILDGELPDDEPEAIWRCTIARYPSLAGTLGAGRPVVPFRAISHLQRRVRRVVGDDWVLLPHAAWFASPLFSTGIALSLAGVERLALLFEGELRASEPAPALARYGRRLEADLDHLDRLVAGGYHWRREFERFVAWSMLYFAAASWAETRQRLLPAPEALGHWAWSGFLGASDPVLEGAVKALEAVLGGSGEGDLEAQVARLIAPRNVAGLADPTRRWLYPVDLEALVASAGRLGLEPEAVRAALPRLRGE